MCAPLCYTDPDAFASRFGVVAAEEPGALRAGLESLLEGDRWQRCGQHGYEHVRDVFSTDRAMDAHLDVYGRLD